MKNTIFGQKIDRKSFKVPPPSIRHSLNGDPQSYHLENLAFKLNQAQIDETMYAEITDKELEALEKEIKLIKQVEEFNNDQQNAL